MGVGEAGRGTNAGYVTSADVSTPLATEEDLMDQPVLTQAGQDYLDSLPDYKFDPADFGGTVDTTDDDRAAATNAAVSEGGSAFDYGANVGANNTMEALGNLANDMEAGKVDATEASATLGLLGYGDDDLTPAEIESLLPPAVSPSGAVDTPEVAPAPEPSTLSNIGELVKIGTVDYLPALGATGIEQLASAGLATGQDLGIIGDRVLNPAYTLQQAGVSDRNALDRLADELYMYSTGDYNVNQITEPMTLQVPMAETSLESALNSYAAGQFDEMAEKITRLPDDVKSALAAEVVSIPDKFGYSEGQVDPGFASALGEDPNAANLAGQP